MRDRIQAASIPEPNSGCWLWLNAIKSNGYGVIAMPLSRKIMAAHRASYEAFVGTIPDGMDVCHRCDVRCCVNPDHLFVGTRRDNVHDMMRKKRYWANRKPSKRAWNAGRRAWAIP